MRAWIAISALCLLALPGVSAAADRLITVSGEGRISAAPDTAWITTSVVTEAATAREAMAANSARMNAVMERLQSVGIPAANRRTSGLSLQPRWTRPELQQNRAPVIDGFTARNELTLRITDLEGFPELLDLLVSDDAANTFGGIRFGLADPQAAEDDALTAAVADARRKAELLASAAGASLGEVLSITEGGAFAPRPEMMMRMDAESVSSGVPVSPGEVEITASVTLVLALQD